MQYIKEGKAAATRAVADRLRRELVAKKRVIWLVSGGSNISIEVEIMNVLNKECHEYLSGLAIIPIDERYGPAGHKDSNTQQLRDAGFNSGAAIWIDVLTGNKSFEETVRFYGQAVTVAFTNADIIVGQIGMGSDGHILGILPNSPAAHQDEDRNVVGYRWNDYTRMTLSVQALKRVDVVYALIFGADKKEKLNQLYSSKDANPVEFPAELLIQLPEVYIYNDSINSREGR